MVYLSIFVIYVGYHWVTEPLDVPGQAGQHQGGTQEGAGKDKGKPSAPIGAGKFHNFPPFLEIMEDRRTTKPNGPTKRPTDGQKGS